MLAGDILEMLGLVKDHPGIARQDQVELVIPGLPPHREIGKEEMMVGDHHLAAARLSPRLVIEALLVELAVDLEGLVGLRKNLLPDLPGRLPGEIREAAIPGGIGPLDEIAKQLLVLRILRNQVELLRSLLDPALAGVVGAPLDERELEIDRQDSREKGKILRHQLFLQVDGAGGDDHPLSVLDRPENARHQVGEALANPGAGLRGDHPVLVQRAGHLDSHLYLALTALKTIKPFREHSPGTENAAHLLDIDWLVLVADERLDHEVIPHRLIVDDDKTHLPVAQLGGHSQVGLAGLQVSARMVVDRQVPALGPGENGRRRDVVSARENLDLDKTGNRLGLVPAHLPQEIDLVPASLGDGFAEKARRFRRNFEFNLLHLPGSYL